MSINLIQLVAQAAKQKSTTDQVFGTVSQLKAVSEAAVTYLSQGLMPVPVPLGHIGPQIKGWPHFQCTFATIPKFFCGKCNISILTGAPSGGLVDIDVDSPSARLLAPHFLPHTNCVFGRLSPHTSHYLYRVSEPMKSKEYSISDGPNPGVIVEIRGDGHLTMAPPSVHPKGGTVQFAAGRAGLPTVVDRDLLERSVMLLAMATTIYEVWPAKSGNRQDLALALAGALT